jgi:hypothetical protein
MVQSKLNEPTATGFDDPNEWSEDDMRSWLKEVSLACLSPQMRIFR